MTGEAVVIGGGPNGLAAAIRLAEAGVAVTVLEAADHAGGAVRTEELTLPGFRHDTFSAVYPAAAASPVFARMPLAEHGLEWIHPRACMAHPLPDGSAAVLYRDLEATARSLDRQHAGDGERWAEFASPYLDGFAAVRATMLSGFPPVGGALRLLGSAGPTATLGFARLLIGPATSLGHRLFRGQGSRVWLYGAAMHGDAPPGKPGSGIAAFYLNLLGHAVGWPSPRGGAQRLADALVGYLRSLGGSLQTGARVERILAGGGRVRGVGVAGGQELPASIVIADVMPHALVAMAGDALSGWYRQLLDRYVYGPGTVKVDWALDGPIPWRAREVHEAGTVHVGGDEQSVLEAIAGSATGLPERPFLLCGQQSTADATRAPEHKHTAWAYTHGPNGIDGLGGERHVERIEAQVERFAPGFRERVLARHVLGPMDMQARNANLVGGDVGGGSYRLRQAVFRPLPKLSPYHTALPGLFLGSAATFPGGAVHGVPGDAAARAALRRRGRRADRAD
ncbi:MAG: NAD(P)/FAD-dependent oxidoreductase [Solirubrobacterales bacterium]|nr:NAD(P)/FAD-dependent oxidoreductase [Solirubrobacterales bacterium]MBV9717173.1 NAD(P)/FAD-dependent oxidoreductase [Solirubrobacterales bacterium]